MLKRFANKIILLITITITAVFIYNYCLGSSKWSPTIRFYGDALGYYMYLPSIFVYHSLESPDQLPRNKYIQPDIFNYSYDLKNAKTFNGKTFLQYTYGVAFMESPFFFAAHAYERVCNRGANGYSLAYIYMIKTATLFYALLGLLIVYIILKKYFEPTFALLGTITIFLGTNLFWFSLYQSGMAHVPLFFLYALIMLLTIKIHQKPSWQLFVKAGFTAGLITLIRPTDLLCLLIPLLYNVYNIETIKSKAKLIKGNGRNILLSMAAFIIPIIPQLLYWKAITGHYVYYSYEDQSFNWSHPKIIEGLFYCANGWLAYSPVMIFSVLGLLMYKQLKNWKWVLWVIFPVYVYIIYSWYCFNYINGLGSRPMINIYPLLALPFTAFLVFISRSNIVTKTLFSLVCLFFIAMNLSYSVQQAKGILVSESSNMVYNSQILFKTHLEYNDLVVLDLAERQPDTNSIKKVCTLACENFDDSTSSQYIKDTSGKYVFRMTKQEYQAGFTLKYDKKKFRDAKWLKCSGRFMYPEGPPSWKKHVLVLEIPGKLWKGCQIENKIGGWTTSNEIIVNYAKENQWGTVYFYTKIPENVSDGDVIKVFVWDLGQRDLYIDDVCLELYK